VNPPPLPLTVLGFVALCVLVFVLSARERRALLAWREWARAAGFTVDESMLPSKPQLMVSGERAGSPFQVEFWGGRSNVTIVRVLVPGLPEGLGVCRKRWVLPFRTFRPRIVSTGDAWADETCAVMAADEETARAFFSRPETVRVLRRLFIQERDCVLERGALFLSKPGIARVEEIEQLLQRLEPAARGLLSRAA
jgi:hypothetical protein